MNEDDYFDPPPTKRIPNPRQVARRLDTWVAGYRDDGTPIHEADVETDTGVFTRARLVGSRWEVVEGTL